MWYYQTTFVFFQRGPFETSQFSICKQQFFNVNFQHSCNGKFTAVFGRDQWKQLRMIEFIMIYVTIWPLLYPQVETASILQVINLGKGRNFVELRQNSTWHSKPELRLFSPPTFSGFCCWGWKFGHCCRYKRSFHKTCNRRLFICYR